jgi:hypothetical protein
VGRVGEGRTKVVLALFLLVGCTRQSPNSQEIGFSGPSSSRSPTTSVSPVPTPDGTIAPPGGPGAATGLEAELRCSSTEPRQGVVEFRWIVATQPGTAQRVDVTIYSERFDDSRYESSGTLEPDRSSLSWDRFFPGAVHFWRVLTLHGNTWVPSKVGQFTPGACIGDFVSPSGS